MKVSDQDIQFWLSRQKSPTWAMTYFGKMKTNIHEVVNNHAQIKMSRGELSANNLLVLLKSRRKRGEKDSLYYLQYLSEEPGTVINPKRRAGFARKWYNRIKNAPKSQSH